MHERGRVKQAAVRLELGHDVLISLLDVHALEFRNRVDKAGAGVERQREVSDLHDPIGYAHPVIILSESGSLVDHAGTTVIRDVRVTEHPEGSALEVVEVWEQGLIGLALELDALELGKHLEALLLLRVRLLLPGLLRHRPWDVRQAALSDDVNGSRLRVPDLDVVKLSVDAQGEVGRQGPGGGGPGNHGGAFWVVVQREGDHHGGVADVLVVLASLKVGQRRGACGGVGHDLVATVDEALFPQRLEHPPDALHEGRLHRFVVILEVDPSAETRDSGLPLS
mmetsp:Transcript_17821/g.49841  ORF Transcript_17821/g.49841 Transcript_17821/m.49841 type:complete len:281 (+) Transcript_17821:1519-2361(+)